MNYFNKKLNQLKKYEIKINKNRINNIDYIKMNYFINTNDNYFILNEDIIKLEVYNQYFRNNYFKYINIFNQSLYYYFHVMKNYHLEKTFNKNIKYTEINNLYKDYFNQINNLFNKNEIDTLKNKQLIQFFEIDEYNYLYDYKDLIIKNQEYLQELVNRANEILLFGDKIEDFID